MKTRILLADDHTVFREGLRSLIEHQDDMEVAGEAENSRAAIRLANELQPDVVIMDISMPDLSGIEASRRIRLQRPEMRILALSMYSSWNYVSELMNIGVSGYFLKSDSFEKIAAAIRCSTPDKIYLSPEIEGMLVDRCFKKAESTKSSRVRLDGRQREILRLLAEGKNARQIAGCFNISQKAVEFQRRSLMSKLDIRSIADLVKYAIREGMISLK